MCSMAEQLFQPFLVGILRGIERACVRPLMEEAVLPSGLPAIEVTMNTPGAEGIIADMAALSAHRVSVGAGTVLTRAQAQSAVASGARFLVSPVYAQEVAVFCRAEKIPYIPGALTPHEIYQAWQEGAAMVKVFPASCFGPRYFKEVKAPLNQVVLLACGGVAADTIAQYFACGADAAAFGASIFKPELMAAEQYSEMRRSIEALISLVPRYNRARR